MKILFQIILPVFILFMGCKKDVGANSKDIIPGQVQFSIKNSVTLKQSLDVFKSVGITEYELINFYYSKTIPNDSMQYYFYLLKSRSYITVFNVQKMTGDAFTRFNALKFKNLTETNFQNWDSIVKKEALIEMPDVGDGTRRNGFIYITPGQEKLWIERLKNLSIIYDANYSYVFEPFD